MNQAEVQTMAKEKLGFLPNLLETMSVSPGPVRVYVEGALAMADGVLTEAEQQAVYLATSVFHECAYCTSAHSVMGEGAGVDRADIAALRAGDEPSDARLAALARTTRLVLEKRGHLSADDLTKIEGWGITRPELYDIVTLSSIKTITNWISHIEQPEIDAEFTYRP